MRQNIYLFFFLLLYSNHLLSQTQGFLDSLEQTIDTISAPIKKAEQLNKLASIYQRINIDKAIELAHKSIPLLPINEEKKRGHVYNTLGILYSQNNQIEQAQNYLDTAISLYKKVNYESGISTIYSNLSAFYTQTGDYPRALAYTYKSIAINEKAKKSDPIAHNFNALVAIFFAQNEFEKALKSAKKALRLRLQLAQEYTTMTAQKADAVSPYVINQNNYNIAKTYYNIAISFSKLEESDSCLLYYNQSLTYHKKVNNKEGIVFVYQALASFYNSNEQNTLALEYIQKALGLQEYIVNGYRKIMFQNTLANIYANNGRYNESIQYFEFALNTSKKLGLNSYQKDALEGLAECHEALGNYKEAYLYEKQFATIKDSVLNEVKQKQLKDLEIKYETNKKEQANILLIKERNIEKLRAKRIQLISFALVIILLLVLLSSYFFLRSNKIQTLQKTTKLKHQLLRNQMSPHFIFNALMAIQSFVYKNEVKDAGKYLSSFAKLVRAILENSRNEYITLEKEIQWLENYLKLQLLRFDGKFEYDIILDIELDAYSILIPPMLTQPFIENALEHGLKTIDYQGKLEVSFKIEADLLKIEVQDNGIGLEQAKKNTNSSKHISLATTITQERLSFLNKKKSSNIHFSITPLPLGTLTTFSIPLKYI